MGYGSDRTLERKVEDTYAFYTKLFLKGKSTRYSITIEEIWGEEVSKWKSGKKFWNGSDEFDKERAICRLEELEKLFGIDADDKFVSGRAETVVVRYYESKKSKK